MVSTLNTALKPVIVASVQQKIFKWRTDPVLFVREALNGEPDIWQIEALNAICREDRVSIRSGHGVGKSTLLAWTVLWFLATRYPSKVPCTAPSSHQLFDVLWSEIRLWMRRMDPALADQFLLKVDRLELIGGALECFAVARTARKETPDALQGFHSENLLFIIDEAPGVAEVIFEVAMGALSTPGSKQLLTGNPTSTKGYFARSHDPQSGFYRIHVNAETSPRVTQQFIDDVILAYGKDSNQYRVRVLGEFPTTDEDTLIPLDLVMAAAVRDIFVPPHGCVWGLDVARYGGDNSVLVKRYPRAVIEDPKVWSGLDTMQLTGRVKHEYDSMPPKERPERIFVDVIGMGAGVVDRLLELELPAVGVNVSEKPSMELEGAFRLKDELWLAALKWFQARECKIVNNERLIGELTSIKKSYTSSGKMRVESKDDMKKRGLRSPDVAEAFILTFAYGAAVASGMQSTYTDWKKPLKRNIQGIYV